MWPGSEEPQALLCLPLFAWGAPDQYSGGAGGSSKVWEGRSFGSIEGQRLSWGSCVPLSL